MFDNFVFVSKPGAQRPVEPVTKIEPQTSSQQITYACLSLTSLPGASRWNLRGGSSMKSERSTQSSRENGIGRLPSLSTSRGYDGASIHSTLSSG